MSPKAIKERKKRFEDGTQSLKDASRKRLCGKTDAVDVPNRPLGNRACCCRIGR